MSAIRAFAVLCALCACASWACAAPSAIALTKGTTAFTCQSEITGNHHYNDAHCKEKTGTGTYEHIAIAEGTQTEVLGNNETTSFAKSTVGLKTTQAGVTEELQSENVAIGGTVKNLKEASGEHAILGEGTIEFKEVVVTQPAGKGCTVKGGQITTNKLKVTTAGHGDFLKVEAAAGPMAEYTLQGCAIAELNTKHEVLGSLLVAANGATLIFTHVEGTEATTLTVKREKGAAVKAGLTGSFTLKGRETAGAYTPLTGTTFETP